MHFSRGVLCAGGGSRARGVRGGVPGPSGTLLCSYRSDPDRNPTQSHPGPAPTGPCLSPRSAAPTSRKSSSTPQPTAETFLSRLCHDESPVVWWPASCSNLDFAPPPSIIFGFFDYADTVFSRAATPPPHIAGPGTRALEILWHSQVNAPSARKWAKVKFLQAFP